MKLLGFNILKQKTLEERLAKARNEAVVMPNKMITIMRQHGLVRNRIISKLLWQIHSPHRESLMQAYQKAQMALREKVRNAC